MKRTLPSFLLALGAITAAQAAQAQEACIAPADLDDTILYAMPLAYDATMTACGGSYSDDGFMKAEGPAFADRFREKQDAAWPGAFRLLKVFAQQRATAEAQSGASDPDMFALLDSMPPESLRPFIDALVQQMITAEIKSDSCEKIERGVSLIAPLPVENVSGLVTFIAETAELKNPQVCVTGAETADETSETAE